MVEAGPNRLVLECDFDGWGDCRPPTLVPTVASVAIPQVPAMGESNQSNVISAMVFLRRFLLNKAQYAIFVTLRVLTLQMFAYMESQGKLCETLESTANAHESARHGNPRKS